MIFIKCSRLKEMITYKTKRKHKKIAVVAGVGYTQTQRLHLTLMQEKFYLFQRRNSNVASFKGTSFIPRLKISICST